MEIHHVSEHQTRSSLLREHEVTVTAVAHERCCGTASGILHDHDRCAEITTVETEPPDPVVDESPEVVESALVEALAQWAFEQGATRVERWVALNDGRRLRQYRRLGFERTGETRPAPASPGRAQVKLQRPLVL